MQRREYAAWVAPIAATLAADRRELIEVAIGAPPDFWERDSALVPGWTNKDILAHLAGGNDRLVQTVLAAVVGGTALDASQLAPDTDDENALGVAERRDWPVARLIAELERDGEETQNLLSRLTEDDAEWAHVGFKPTLRQFLEIVHAERHDAEHLGQLRAALDAPA